MAKRTHINGEPIYFSEEDIAKAKERMATRKPGDLYTSEEIRQLLEHLASWSEGRILDKASVKQELRQFLEGLRH